ncbi:hypothetical protein F7734_30350 [Scytonema sp. UIC 10036]|uniref:hypothetical protein n=1 Tax=Scytonema sp. UIC 10036 TaxID=2304196 RepID=UPI0012DA8415|nr:hypothetical protein [Scytonema sp. UIC 10036]MUG96417.1 hypothetical protein [Scytonema sp. UIC 10036]
MLHLKNKFLKIAIPFFSLYIVSIVILVSFGYIVKNYREIEEYKLLTLWYENLDPQEEQNPNRETQDTNNFSSFIKKAQHKLKEDYQTYFKKPESKKLPSDIKEKIILGQNSPKQGSVQWKIEKTGETVEVYYDYTGLNNFNSTQDNNSNPTDREQEKKRNADNKIFQNFTYMMTSKIKPSLDSKTTGNQNDIQNLQNFSKVVVKYLTGDDRYSDIIPDLRINNIYITNIKTGFMMSYPFTNEAYKQDINFKIRPWFRTTQQDNYYVSNFRAKDDFSNDLGLTGVYIDINDETKPNVIRTLWYKFKLSNKNEEYILCIDLFFDKSSHILQKGNLLNLSEQSIKYGFNLKENDNPWIYLLGISFIMALCLYSIYELKIKNIILRISKFQTNDLLKIKLQLDSKHYASKDEGEIKFTVQGETKEINQSAQSMEAKWSFNIQNLQFGVSNNQNYTRQKEASTKYEFINEYNLNMSQSKPQYRCIETWKVVLESQSGKTQKIGFFVAKWNTNNSAAIEEVLDIKSIYWEKEYEKYLSLIKEQLREHVLISDEKELVAVLDTNYTKRQNLPSFLTEIDSLKKIIKSSLYLKQGKIVFSEVETLTELYRQPHVMVHAICTLHFLRNLIKNNKLNDFVQIEVHERYLIEYQQDEFQEFYDSLDDEHKLALSDRSPFKIMVYQDNIENIVSPQDDFCIISVNNNPKLVAYSFTDNKYSNTGWISWREVDIKFYEELYKCQKDKNHRIEDIKTYLS